MNSAWRPSGVAKQMVRVEEVIRAGVSRRGGKRVCYRYGIEREYGEAKSGHLRKDDPMERWAWRRGLPKRVTRA